MRTVVARLESNLNATKLLGFTDCYEGKILSQIYYALMHIIILLLMWILIVYYFLSPNSCIITERGYSGCQP